MTFKTVELNVCDDFVLPKWFQTATPQDIADALRIIPPIFNHVTTLASQGELVALKDAVHASRQNIDDALKQQNTTLTRQINELRATLNRQEIQTQEIVQQRNNSMQAFSEVSGILGNLKSHLNDKLVEMQRTGSTSNSDISTRFDHINHILQARMDDITKTIETTISAVHFNNACRPTAEIGRIGEESIDDMLASLPTTCTWRSTDTSGLNGRGDRLYDDGKGFKVMVEVKNAKALHSKRDIEKFQRDAETCTSEIGYCSAAVLISLRTKSIPDRGPVFLEFVNKKPVLWLASDNPATVLAALVLLRSLAHSQNQYEEETNVPNLNAQDQKLITKSCKTFIAYLSVSQERILALEKNAADISATIKDMKLEIQDAIFDNENAIANLSFGADIDNDVFETVVNWFSQFFQKNSRHATPKHKIPQHVLGLMKRKNTSTDHVRDVVCKRLRLDG
jgi:hypothetical protein